MKHYEPVVDTVLFCPKCGSTEVAINDVHTERRRKSMDELTQQPKNLPITDVVRTYLYRAVCTFCGYAVEYERHR